MVTSVARVCLLARSLDLEFKSLTDRNLVVKAVVVRAESWFASHAHYEVAEACDGYPPWSVRWWSGAAMRL